jgi:hypothetical protein
MKRSFRERAESPAKREVIWVSALCPVLAALACLGSGGSPQDTVARMEMEPADILGPASFEVVPAAAETIDIAWEAPGPVVVTDVAILAGDSVASGDTIAVGRDSLASLEMERIRMLIAFAEASGGGQPGVDVYSATIDSLEAEARLALLAPEGGVVVSLDLAPGRMTMPGVTAARLLLHSDDLFTILAPQGASMHAWPAGDSSFRLVEPGISSAVYSGSVPAGSWVFPGSIGLSRRAILDEELGSFTVTEAGDTVSVFRICTCGDTVTVVPGHPIRGRVLEWTASLEGERR